MADIITIYCEGKKGSHDFDILEKVTEGISSANISIIPIGGKRGANAIIEFNETGKTVQSDFYLFFRDRDFDRPVPEDGKLTFDGNKTYFGYRTTIENYLFGRQTFYHFVEKKGLKEKYRLFSEDDVKRIFIEAAKDIKYYQAIRHVLGEMRTGASFNTTWTGGSGDLPDDLSLDTCKNNAWSLVQKAKSIADDWTETKFNSSVNKYISLFDETFFDGLKFSVYFQGKDFGKSLTNRLKDFPLSDYYKFAKDNFGDYSKSKSPENRLYDDLVELRQIIVEKKHKT